MSPNENSSFIETINLFYSESSNLEDAIGQSLKNSEGLSRSEIIGLYFQVINVTSLTKFLMQNLEDPKNTKEDDLLLQRIQEIEKYIGKKFNSNLHLLLMLNLEKSIETSKKKLKEFTANQSKKTKEVVGNQAKMYDELRQIMSTKEFVDQYNNEINSVLEN